MSLDGSGGRLNSGDGMRSMGQQQQQQQQRGPGKIFTDISMNIVINKNLFMRHLPKSIFTSVYVYV